MILTVVLRDLLWCIFSNTWKGLCTEYMDKHLVCFCFLLQITTWPSEITQYTFMFRYDVDLMERPLYVGSDSNIVYSESQNYAQKCAGVFWTS